MPPPGDIIGFTGTRKGMSDAQLEQVGLIVLEVKPRWVVHGGAVGADLQFHDLCHMMGISSEVWPARSDLPDWVVDSALEIKDVKPPLERNADIVNNCDLLIACPKGYKEEHRSGTWATIRYARRSERRYAIVWPNGDVIHHG